MSDPNFHKSRWLYKKDGRDVGPFRPHELERLLVERTISRTTLVRNLTQQDFRPLDQLLEFRDLLQRADAALANADKERVFDKQLAREKSARRAPVVLVVLVVMGAAGGTGYWAWQRYGVVPAAPSGISTDLIRPLELPALTEHGYIDTKGTIQWTNESVAQREAAEKAAADAAPKARKKPSTAAVGAAGRPVGADDLAPESGEAVELDFSKDEPEGRELPPGELSLVSSRARDKLVSCAQAEAERSNGFPGTTVRFTLANSGKPTNIRFGKNGGDSAAFTGCVRSALERVTVEPFGGVAPTLTVPLEIRR